MIQKSIERLEYLLANVPQLLYALPEEDFNQKPGPDKWSKKEITGHLIDSACNNHQRLIRAQYDPVTTIAYQQDKWNALNFYATAKSADLLNLWESYNKQLLHLIRNIPHENLQLTCYNGLPDAVSLAWLIEDYVQHLEHHLKQMVTY